VDREALEHSLVRRLLDHIDNGTTDLADEVIEVPASTYTSPERHDAELEVLFLDHPVVLCLSGALPKPGSYLAVDLCETPVLLTRDNDGRVHAFLNACRHRGVRVVDGGMGEGRRFTCPFHAWTYDIVGNLAGLPVASAFDGMCREDKGLVELPVDEGYGLVVGRLRPGPEVDVDDYLGPGLAEELAMLEFGDWVPVSAPHVHEVGANWKVTLDTYRENYHFDYLHRTTLKDYAHGGVLTFDPFGRHLRNASAVRTIGALRDIPEEEWGDVMAHFTYQYALFPNTSFTVGPRHAELWQILPVDAHRSEVLHTTYLRPDLTDEQRAVAIEQIPWICGTVVDGEDFWVAGRTEPGLSTGVIETVIFGRNEPAPQHLHQGFAAALAEHAATHD
jgi:phenylpropionate dioxygenase-like ring-hydroxylating dioxygenase large terminal subunit